MGLAALAGWACSSDEAQQTLALLLFPAWILSEFSFAAEGHIGKDVYMGRFLIAWAVLYLTIFLGSRRKVVQGILFAASAIAALVGVVVLLGGWRSWGQQAYLPIGVRGWGWVDIAALPLMLACIKLRKSLVPVAVAIVFSTVLPSCQRVWTEVFDNGAGGRYPYVNNEPNLAAHALVAAFTVFIIWWGVHQASKALVNLGIAGFSIAVGWFYFSNIFDKVGRSLGLIGLGVLFLAGGWVLEKARRRLIDRMGHTNPSMLEDK